ncbi:MAG: chemotaxis-specific protein-glutamate methyltransferase CheB [Campylobacterota bacterium]|nr:chemotaxis-specific protein-glutamate methyltransferase CheB [Campylobacterota bacterium]
MIKVFIIDDSLLVRNSINKMLKGEYNIKVIGEAPNPVDAFTIFKKVGLPDVFILDIEMPKMDGLTFLKQLNEQNPVPVVICSTLVSHGSTEAVDALRLGAVSIIQKPKVNVGSFFMEQKEELLEEIKAASLSKLSFTPKSLQKRDISQGGVKEGEASKNFIAVGSSTGGVQVIEEVVVNLKPDHEGIVITQHMPAGFTGSFADRLNSITRSKVVEASDDELIAKNKIIIAKGGVHMTVYKDNDGNYRVKLKDFPKVNSHKPSVNVLFNSIVKSVGDKVTAFILTGMGDDGATGIKKLKELGNKTYGQNENSCVVYGMPRTANLIGGVDKEVSINEIYEIINKL